jgi:hypothetical protein
MFYLHIKSIKALVPEVYLDSWDLTFSKKSLLRFLQIGTGMDQNFKLITFPAKNPA